MAHDYSDRNSSPSSIPRNRPKQRSISLVTILFTLCILLAYGFGIATGWFFFRIPAKQVTINKPTPAPVSSAQPPTPLKVEGDVRTQPVPLTFYDTLPKGEKGVMGSGLNPRTLKPGESQPVAKPAPTLEAGHQKPAETVSKPASAAAPPKAPAVTVSPASPASPAARLAPVLPSPVAKKEIPPLPAKGADSEAQQKKYAVQLASTVDKQEAETLKERYIDKGISAYLVTIEIKGKGVWYRVRTGRKLSESEAKKLAAGLGGKAMVVPE